jgi:GNAT superfamily N-acetyltransferase
MSDLMTLSQRQFIGAWRSLSLRSPYCSLHSEPGLECTFSGTPISFFNAISLTGRDLSADAVRRDSERARAWASDKNVPWLLVVTPGALTTPAECESILDSCGYAPLLPLTGMLKETAPPPKAAPSGLDLRTASDDEDYVTLFAINSAAYGMDLPAGEVWGRASTWQDDVMVVGYENNQPASSAGVIDVEGHNYVALVATDPQFQRRGFADATMRRALELAEARFGQRPTFLHASAAGQPVYERMGYRVVCPQMIYMDRAFLGGH